MIKNLHKRILITILSAAATLSLSAATDEQKNSYFETYGWGVGKQSGIEQLKPTPEEAELFLKGLKSALNGGPAPSDIQSIQKEMNSYFRARAGITDEDVQHSREEMEHDGESSHDAEAAPQNKEAGKAFIEQLVSSNAKIKKTDSGLYYEIIESGNENKPGPTSQVEVHYEGKLINGEVFDSSIKRGETVTFGLNQVIPGWTEGLQLIGEGGKIKLYIPSNLAYGDRGNPSIPAGSTLIFDVQLISIKGGIDSQPKEVVRPEKVPTSVVTEPLSVTDANQTSTPAATEQSTPTVAPVTTPTATPAVIEQAAPNSANQEAQSDKSESKRKRR
jgi:FKBP-type peptidyl-prolyl cis-trans isomerase